MTKRSSLSATLSLTMAKTTSFPATPWKASAPLWRPQGKLKEALSQYQKLERNSYNVEPDRAIYHQGRVQLQLGDTEKARELFRNLLDKYPESSLRQEVQNRLAFLELQKQAATPEEGKADGNKAPDGGKG
jgi:tetratricopeptide (TPR) repeat protein